MEEERKQARAPTSPVSKHPSDDNAQQADQNSDQ